MFNNTQTQAETENSTETKELGKREKEIIYRGRMGSLFKELNALVPELKNQKCASRLLILEKTIHLINQLQTNQMILHQEKVNLAQENFQLKQLIHAYSNSTNTFPSPTKSFTL